MERGEERCTVTFRFVGNKLFFMIKINKYVCVLILVLGGILDTYSQQSDQEYLFEYQSRDVEMWIKLEKVNDSIITAKQTVRNSSDSLDLFYIPLFVRKSYGFPLPGDTNDILIYSSARPLGFNVVESDIEVFRVLRGNISCYYQTFHLRNLDKVKWVHVLLAYVFAKDDINKKLFFLRKESVTGEECNNDVDVFSISFKDFAKACTWADFYQKNIILFHNATE